MGILVTPGLSNLTKLSAIHLSGPLGSYEVIGTFPGPHLQQLVLCFDELYGDELLPDPVPPLFNTGALVGLTKLEINSYTMFRQVDILPWHLTLRADSTFKGNSFRKK